jgi:hypothetical protein
MLAMCFDLTLWAYVWEIDAEIVQVWVSRWPVLVFAGHVYCVPLHVAWLVSC